MGRMAESYIKSKNEMIRKRKRKKRIRNSILIIILFVSILTTLALKLQYFNIKEINVVGNGNVTPEEIINLSNIYKGNNIFYINLAKSKTNIKRNSYIVDVKITRKLPSTLVITVKEREAAFYCSKGDNFLIINKEGYALEEKTKLTNENLIKLNGFDVNNTNIGEKLKCDDPRKLVIIEELTELVLSSSNDLLMTSVDVTDLLDIKVFYKDICVKLGTSSNLKEKLNKAINIYTKAKLENSKGYIDVRFNSMPVYFIEK